MYEANAGGSATDIFRSTRLFEAIYLNQITKVSQQTLYQLMLPVAKCGII